MIVDLTELEIDLLERSLSYYISDYYITDLEENKCFELIEKLEKMTEFIVCLNCEIKDVEDQGEGCSGCLVFRNFRNMLLNGYDVQV